MTGALSFIGLLLVLAGVERNPGPDKKFVFRYQYLLIEVGTGVLRMVFDYIVGSDFKVYLDNNPSQKAKFQHLLSRNILTPVQRKLLPPFENTPSSDKFDITLLTCLLRNACGLCPSSDQVWLNPQPTDNRVEAYIAKLKKCRNDLAHSGSVLEDDTDLTTKWNELCLILQGLASYCGFPNLQEEIDKSESIELDDRLKKKFENAIKDWQREKDDLRSDMSSLSTTVGTLVESKKQHDDEIASLSTTVRTLEESKKQHGDEIVTLSSTVGHLEESKKHQGDEIATLSTTVGKLEESKKHQGDEIATLSTTVGTLEESKKQHGDKIATLSTTVGTLVESKKQHGDEIATLSTTVGTLEESKRTLEESQKQHGDEIATLSTTVRTLEESKKQHGDEIATLSTTVGTLEESKKQHDDEIAILYTRTTNSEERLSDKDKADIQRRLINTYQEDNFSSLPMCPQLEHEKGDILRLYEIPTMYAVNYHKVEKQQTDQSWDKSKEVKTCSNLFHVKGKDCKNIYLTGDAGVGKTSFCKFLSLLWCKSKSGEQLEKSNMQEYIDYLDKFEFVFYVNLRDTYCIDLIQIVVNELFYSENNDKRNKMYRDVEAILENPGSLVIMDGLDEWIPESTDKRTEIPVRSKLLKCVYLTTCRPYKIENVRLSQTDLDHQVQMTGLGKLETESYVKKLISLIKTKFVDDKNAKDFFTTVEQANMSDQLNIPMVTSHLVMLWFHRQLKSMTKSIIYGNIMDMLYELAHEKRIAIPKPLSYGIKLPDQLSELEHFKSHFTQVEKLCFLSYDILFEQNTDITCLVFTRKQLAKKPYSLSEEETNLFCKIGILSMKKIVRNLSPKECKLSFLHKSYLEFFAAIYVSTLCTRNVLELFSKCRTINDVLKYKNFLIFYAGLSRDNFLSLMTRIYLLITRDLDLARVSSIFSTYWDTKDKTDQLLSLQDLILKCNMQGSHQIENSLPLEDFTFDSSSLTDTETKYLRKFILSNSKNVRRLRSETGVYLDEFDTINNLQVLYIQKCKNKCYRDFKELIKQNKSSLQIISIEGDIINKHVLHLPLEDLRCLTSLSLRYIDMSHEDIQYLTKFLSNNSQLKHIRLNNVKCTDLCNDECEYNDVCGSFELVQCNKLVHFEIGGEFIACTNINTSSLENITLNRCSESIARSCTNVFNSIQYALELKHLQINGKDKLDDYLLETLITNVQYLSKIETIFLMYMTIRVNCSFLLHPSVKKISIILYEVNMTARWFQTFIENVIDKHCCIILILNGCIIRQDDGDIKRDMSETESLDHIYSCIESIPAIKIGIYAKTRPCRISFRINDNH